MWKNIDLVFRNDIISVIKWLLLKRNAWKLSKAAKICDLSLGLFFSLTRALILKLSIFNSMATKEVGDML